MSSFIKFSSQYRDAIDDTLDRLNNAYQERLNQAFLGVKVFLKIPQGNGFAYDRDIVGLVKSVQLKFSRPDIDIPLLMCHFEIEGADQFGAPYNDVLKEKDLSGKIPWDNFSNFERIDLTLI